MDIISHGLWGALLARTANKRLAEQKEQGSEKRGAHLDATLAAFWGIFPDLFAFAPIFAFFIGGMLFGELHPGQLPRPRDHDPVAEGQMIIYPLTQLLYNITHSMVMWAVVVGLVILLGRVWAPRYLRLTRFPWEMTAWLFHIAMDIPTHSTRFYPTPFLWPVAEVRVDGIPWSTPWIMALNYGAMILIYLWTRRAKSPVLQPVPEKVPPERRM